MNLVEMLSRELRDKHFTEFERVRYVYIRCCQIFSFDARWNYFTLFSDELIKEIEERKFDVKNIDSPLVICHSFSRYILKPLLDELTGAKTEVVGSKQGHSYVKAYFGSSKWNLDATEGDFPRVKMGLAPMGFQQEEGDVPSPDIDEEIGFKFISKQRYQDIDSTNGYNFMGKVAQIISTSKCKYHYSDIAFLYNYMTYLNRQATKTLLDDKGQLYRTIHFTDNDEDYVLAKQNGEYVLQLVKRVTR
ncbi:MAG: hypothetical protein IKP07_02510 [Bacilli bacterium]|nr:hypothetical protein [Bacilli bacterium]